MIATCTSSISESVPAEQGVSVPDLVALSALDLPGSDGEPMENERERIQMNLGIESLDQHWKEHLYDIDVLRRGISFRAYAQKDPLLEYTREAYNMFENMTYAIREGTVRFIYARQFLSQAELAKIKENLLPKKDSDESATRGAYKTRKPEEAIKKAEKVKVKAKTKATKTKIGRNDPCPCGSGKKYKKCCGRG